jgi:hypothetical protein
MAKRAGNGALRRAAASAATIIPLERMERAILVLREQRVMLDADLAAFYGVPTKRLNEQVKRNRARFPADFAFELTPDEFADLRSQIATSSSDWGGRRYRPLAFTEHGAIMAASVLNSERAVQVSLLVVRAFVRLRQILTDHRELARRIENLEREFAHKTEEHEEHIRRIYAILDDLMNPPAPPRKGQIGFLG